MYTRGAVYSMGHMMNRGSSENGTRINITWKTKSFIFFLFKKASGSLVDHEGPFFLFNFFSVIHKVATVGFVEKENRLPEYRSNLLLYSFCYYIDSRRIYTTC